MDYNEIFERYLDNIDKADELNSIIDNITSKETWIKNIKTRADSIQQLYMDNCELISLADELNSKEIKDNAEADSVFDIAFEYYKSFYDTQILAPMFLRLIKYYESVDNPDINLLLTSYYIYSACVNEVDKRNNKEKLFLDYHKEIIKYKSRFNELTRLGRVVVLSAFDCLISTTIESVSLPIDEIFKYLVEFMDFLKDDNINKLLEESDLMAKKYEYVNKSLNIYDLIDKFDDEKINYLKEHLRYAEQELSIDTMRVKQAHIALDINDKKLSYVEAADLQMKYFNEIVNEFIHTDWNSSNKEILQVKEHALWIDFVNSSIFYENIVSKIYDIEVRNELFFKMDKYVNTLWRDIKSPDIVNIYPQLISTWVYSKLRYISDKEELKKCIFDSILKKQIPTYLHSIMVKNIALAIYEESKELFNNVPVADIHEYISDSALLHDIGKITIANIVNTQDRKLSDEEFKGIKNHPRLGVDILENTSLLDSIKDIVKYHHKSYDGKFGYPNDNGNLTSKYRIVIDLITIADSLDAATDYLGRNYKKAKSADVVFQELEKEMGTRYNPDLVNVILNSESLRNKLISITGVERADLMFEAYQEGLRNNSKGLR